MSRVEKIIFASLVVLVAAVAIAFAAVSVQSPPSHPKDQMAKQWKQLDKMVSNQNP